MTKTEFKKYWGSKTLGELRGYISERERVLENIKEDLAKAIEDLKSLSENDKYYGERLYALGNKIKDRTKDIRDDLADLALLKPILEQKEKEGLDEAMFKKYCKDNEPNLKVLLDAIDKNKQEFIKLGGEILVAGPKGKSVTIKLTLKQINEMYDCMYKELMFILKDNIGNVESVAHLRTNGNRGFDGSFKGDKGSVNISTILAGGYNVQKLHLRTLVYAH
jgi:hypothetical protein